MKGDCFMKTKSIFIVMLLAVSMFFVGCKKESKGLTRVTYYPVITLEGDNVVVIERGEEYVEPGFTCTMGEDDVTDQVTVSGEVDSNECGFYTITYTSPNNADGFGASTSRTVVVHVSDPLEGSTFAVVAPSLRNYNGNEVAYDKGDGAVYTSTISYCMGDGVYVVDDMFGGWYSQRAGYGANYNMEGYIHINDDNTIELIDSHVAGWGDSLDYLEEGTFDPETGVLHWKVGYAGVMFFDITFQKQ